ncbi:unnamed protein product [Cuscuta europaea]|uniref:Uncharacterized protein n=1 Tax=Cuscuta europaea TaxID=41803 RepID=A0A9P0ZDG6_CUSEU|nr:unnamed protein product [Cuscuta europaea]
MLQLNAPPTTTSSSAFPLFKWTISPFQPSPNVRRLLPSSSPRPSASSDASPAAAATLQLHLHQHHHHRPRLRHRHRLRLPRTLLHRPSGLLHLLPLRRRPPPPPRCRVRPPERQPQRARGLPPPHNLLRRGGRWRRGAERRRRARSGGDQFVPETRLLEEERESGKRQLVFHMPVRVQGFGDAQDVAGLPALLPRHVRRCVAEAQPVVPRLPEFAVAHSDVHATVGGRPALTVFRRTAKAMIIYDYDYDYCYYCYELINMGVKIIIGCYVNLVWLVFSLQFFWLMATMDVWICFFFSFVSFHSKKRVG